MEFRNAQLPTHTEIQCQPYQPNPNMHPLSTGEALVLIAAMTGFLFSVFISALISKKLDKK